MTVEIDSFLSKYIGGFIPQKTFIDILKKQMNGEKFYMISEADYSEIIKKYNEHQELNSEWKEITLYQNQGMIFEKQGQLDKAVESYEKAIVLGEASPRVKINAYLHSVERLAIVYRKLKRYDDEIRVVLIGLKYQDANPSDNYYVRLRKRLSKAKSLLDK